MRVPAQYIWIFAGNRAHAYKMLWARQAFLRLALLTAKTFWETANALSEYRDDCKVFVYFDGGSKASLYCILRERFQ